MSIDYNDNTYFNTDYGVSIIGVGGIDTTIFSQMIAAMNAAYTQFAQKVNFLPYNWLNTVVGANGQPVDNYLSAGQNPLAIIVPVLSPQASFLQGQSDRIAMWTKLAKLVNDLRTNIQATWQTAQGKIQAISSFNASVRDFLTSIVVAVGTPVLFIANATEDAAKKVLSSNTFLIVGSVLGLLLLLKFAPHRR